MDYSSHSFETRRIRLCLLAAIGGAIAILATDCPHVHCFVSPPPLDGFPGVWERSVTKFLLTDWSQIHISPVSSRMMPTRSCRLPSTALTNKIRAHKKNIVTSRNLHAKFQLQLSATTTEMDGKGDTSTPAEEAASEHSYAAEDAGQDPISPDSPLLQALSDTSEEYDADPTTSASQPASEYPVMSFRSEANTLFLAFVIGVCSGAGVSVFKLSIDAVRQLAYDIDFMSSFKTTFPIAFIPALGGLMVSLLNEAGEFPPGLRGQVEELDDQNGTQLVGPRPFRYFRKAAAAIATLGTGNSLGPEGPAVECGMGVSRMLMEGQVRTNRFPRLTIEEQKLLLACGASAGVSAGFNAPIAAVFFALEIVQTALLPPPKENRAETITLNRAIGRLISKRNGETIVRPTLLSLSTKTSITAILLSSVLSALIARAILRDHLTFHLKDYSLASPLVELPLYLLLGCFSGIVAFSFSQAAKKSKDVFDGVGPVWTQRTFGKIPKFFRPVVGGLTSGFVGLAVPQILFFGYETLNALMANNSLPTITLLTLLIVKMFTTAVAVGSGLVGGTFAPSLFFGAILGASFHNCANVVITQANEWFASSSVPLFPLADLPAYAMVGAASVLAALFRAPLTASLLLFELTRDYDVILPLMASAGVGSLVGDILESKLEARTERRRTVDTVSWGDLADRDDRSEEDLESLIAPRTE